MAVDRDSPPDRGVRLPQSGDFNDGATAGSLTITNSLTVQRGDVP